MPNEVEIRITRQDQAKLDELGRQGKRVGQEVGDGLSKGFKEGEQASERTEKQVKQDLDKMARQAERSAKEQAKAQEQAAKEAERAQEKLAREAKRAADQMAREHEKAAKEIATAHERAAEQVRAEQKDMLEGLTDGLTGGLSGPIATGGAALGGLLAGGILKGVEMAWGEDEIGGLLAAQTGATGHAAGRLGDIAGEVFSRNFGESIEDVGQTIQAVLQNRLIDLNAPQREIERLTELASTASKVVGEEANSIARAARQVLVNDMAGNAEEAIDIIVTASQRGLNVNGDLIDTIVEYGTKFRDLGLKGPEALGLISQAMDAGARDTDFAADALKEFSIRAIDGSESTARGFRSIGLDAGVMADAIAGGGKRAHDALDLTLDKLRAIEDPILRDQAAVDLFGTKAEDLGDSLFAMDLDTVAEKFGKVEGATANAAKAIDEATPRVEKLWNRIRDILGDVTETSLAGWEEFFDIKSFSDVTNQIEGLGPKFETGARKFSDFAEAQAEKSDEATEALERQVKTLDELIAANSELAGGVLDLSEAQIRHQEAIDQATESIEKNKKNLDINTEGGRANQSALNDLAESTYDVIEAMENQGATSQDVQAFVASQREEFVRLATQMGMDATAAQVMADKLGLIPGNYQATVTMNAEPFHAAGAGVFDTLQELGRGVTVPIRASRIGAGLGFAHGGIVGGEPPVLPRAAGGPGRANVLMHEQGEEIVNLPNGSSVIPAGMSQALMSGAFGGGMSGPIDIRLIVGSGATGGVAELMSHLFRTGQVLLEADGVRVQVVG